MIRINGLVSNNLIIGKNYIEELWLFLFAGVGLFFIACGALGIFSSFFSDTSILRAGLAFTATLIFIFGIITKVCFDAEYKEKGFAHFPKPAYLNSKPLLFFAFSLVAMFIAGFFMQKPGVVVISCISAFITLFASSVLYKSIFWHLYTDTLRQIETAVALCLMGLEDPKIYNITSFDKFYRETSARKYFLYMQYSKEVKSSVVWTLFMRDQNDHQKFLAIAKSSKSTHVLGHMEKYIDIRESLGLLPQELEANQNGLWLLYLLT